MSMMASPLSLLRYSLPMGYVETHKKPVEEVTC